MWVIYVKYFSVLSSIFWSNNQVVFAYSVCMFEDAVVRMIFVSGIRISRGDQEQSMQAQPNKKFVDLILSFFQSSSSSHSFSNLGGEEQQH